MRKIILMLALGLTGTLYVLNTSWLATPDGPAPQIISHRGVHQTYYREGLTNTTCTAARINTPTHDYMENTIASMQAAFAAGADIVEIDVHPTTDGRFAVFHDWTLDCRTQGEGTTRSHDMTYLKTLDIGYGYSADGGETFPFRGSGIGGMPTLAEALSGSQSDRFLINFKSREAREGDMLAAMISKNPDWREKIWAVYGGDAPTNRAIETVDSLKGFGAKAAKDCLIKYIGLGWTGYVPKPCRDGFVIVPGNLSWLMWGWPNRFFQRMQSVQTQIILLGPYTAGETGSAGIDSQDQLHMIPKEFSGYIWTNRIEDMGPTIANYLKWPAPDTNVPSG